MSYISPHEVVLFLGDSLLGELLVVQSAPMPLERFSKRFIVFAGHVAPLAVAQRASFLAIVTSSPRTRGFRSFFACLAAFARSFLARCFRRLVVTIFE